MLQAVSTPGQSHSHTRECRQHIRTAGEKRPQPPHLSATVLRDDRLVLHRRRRRARRTAQLVAELPALCVLQHQRRSVCAQSKRQEAALQLLSGPRPQPQPRPVDAEGVRKQRRAARWRRRRGRRRRRGGRGLALGRGRTRHSCCRRCRGRRRGRRICRRRGCRCRSCRLAAGASALGAVRRLGGVVVLRRLVQHGDREVAICMFAGKRMRPRLAFGRMFGAMLHPAQFGLVKQQISAATAHRFLASANITPPSCHTWRAAPAGKGLTTCTSNAAISYSAPATSTFFSADRARTAERSWNTSADAGAPPSRRGCSTSSASRGMEVVGVHLMGGARAVEEPSIQLDHVHFVVMC